MKKWKAPINAVIPIWDISHLLFSINNPKMYPPKGSADQSFDQRSASGRSYIPVFSVGAPISSGLTPPGVFTLPHDGWGWMIFVPEENTVLQELV